MATAAAASAFLALPPPCSLALPQHRRWSSPPPTAAAAAASFVRCHSLAAASSSSAASSQASSPVVAEEDPFTAPPASPPEDVSSPEEAEPNATANFRGCKACGREEIERGCNGEGRIQGGIATVPGFGWWPIKAFRPCPGFVASGGRYRRQGQSMDEVAFGRTERENSVESMDKGKSSKKGAKKLKG